MNYKDRFNNLMSGKLVDKVPYVNYMGGGLNLLEKFKKEGYIKPSTTKEDLIKRFGFEGGRGYMLYPNLYIHPEFEETDIEIKDTGTRKYNNKWGGISVINDNDDFMPITIEGPVSDRKSWDKIKYRLDPSDMSRYQSNWNEIIEGAIRSEEPVYSGDYPCGFFGSPRELFGPTDILYMYHDDPSLMHDVLDTLCDLWIAMTIKMQEKVDLDYYFIWEDMCFKGGPLISPAYFKEFMFPRYKRFIKALRDNGCKNIYVDSDGDQRPLADLWIESGVNILFPWEQQFGLDITEVRKKYPKLGMIGGVNKRCVEYDKAAVDKELEKMPYMFENGYYIPSFDHVLTKDAKFDVLCYYHEKMKELTYKYIPQI